MSAKRPTVIYDPESRILSIRTSKARSVDSDAYGNVVVDYDVRGNAVNIDIMACSLDEFRSVAAHRRAINVHAQIARRRRGVRRGRLLTHREVWRSPIR